jgi:excisionase family DNA binding protein
MARKRRDCMPIIHIGRTPTLKGGSPDETGVFNRVSVLPPNLPPRYLSREQAAEYCGVSPTYFDQLVDDGRMPMPVRLGRRVLWDLRKIDRALDALDNDNAANDPYERQSV